MQEREILEIAQKIEKVGGRLYLVGGAIRDDLLGKKTHDEDYCVTGITAEQFQKIFPEVHIRGKTFKEDPLRVYRVARFLAQLEFKVEQQTIEQMKE